MAHATLTKGPTITVLHVRPDGNGPGEMDRTLRAIATKYGPMVSVKVVTPAQMTFDYGHFSPAGSVLVLRNGQLVSQTAGQNMPRRELDRVVRCAVEWTPAEAP